MQYHFNGLERVAAFQKALHEFNARVRFENEGTSILISTIPCTFCTVEHLFIMDELLTLTSMPLTLTSSPYYKTRSLLQNFASCIPQTSLVTSAGAKKIKKERKIWLARKDCEGFYPYFPFLPSASRTYRMAFEQIWQYWIAVSRAQKRAHFLHFLHFLMHQMQGMQNRWIESVSCSQNACLWRSTDIKRYLLFYNFIGSEICWTIKWKIPSNPGYQNWKTTIDQIPWASFVS